MASNIERYVAGPSLRSCTRLPATSGVSDSASSIAR
jgi:hypothetical protein